MEVNQEKFSSPEITCARVWSAKIASVFFGFVLCEVDFSFPFLGVPRFWGLATFFVAVNCAV